MTDKLIHVNAYTKRDGTEVKEHYRGRGIVASTNPINDDAFESNGGVAGGNPPDPFNTKILDWLGLGDLIRGPYSTPSQQNLVLEGGVSKDVQYPGNTGEALGEVGEAIQVISTLVLAGGQLALRGIQLASSIKQAIENFGEGSVEYMQPELNKTFNLLRSSYTKSKELESATLDKLSETKDQREYERLYKSYVEQREYNKKINHTLNRVEYSLQQKDYDGVVKELQNYHTIQDDSLKNLTQDWTLNQIQPTIPSTADYPLPQPTTLPQDWDYVLRNTGKESPEFQKQAIGLGMNYIGKKAPDANQFWKIATGDVKGYQKYLEQNGCIIDSISQLPFDFKDTVRAKVRQQLYVNDAKGLILRPDSSLSQEIAASPELHKFIKAHLSELLRGEVVSGSSSFKSSDNLHYTLNNADIIDTYINKNGDIVSFILDTYDFNPGEQWYIEWARNVQKHGLITGFYSITIVVVPKDEWLQSIDMPN